MPLLLAQDLLRQCGGGGDGVGGDVKVHTTKNEEGTKGKEGEGRMGEVFFCPFIFLATASTE